jgi:Cd2+/Zn2+-exporting ATPase
MRCQLEGLDCPVCAAEIESALRRVDGLRNAKVNYATGCVELPAEMIEEARRIIAAMDPGLILGAGEAGSNRPGPEASKEEPKQLRTICAAGVLLLIGVAFNGSLRATPGGWLEYAVLLPAYLLAGWPVIRDAFKRLAKGQLIDENFLMSIASFGALAIGQLPEAAGVMVFYAVGEYLQERAVRRSRGSIAALLDIQPEFANRLADGELTTVRPEAVEVGALILVKPGEKVPLDGEVVDGKSLVDTSALTGESAPREAWAGQTVLAGMINGPGVLTVKVTKPYKDSSVARILELVEQAAERKAPTEQFITTFARYYTPAVVGAAMLLAVIPPLALPGAVFSEWLYRALTLLVISCPCALMISIPLGYFGGIGGSSRNGVLIKGANYLDALANLDTVVFDKTGTLTQGSFKVVRVAPAAGFSEAETLAAAAAAESFSNHPIALSIREAHGQEISAARISDYQEIPGYGISAVVDGRRVLAGNDRLLKDGERRSDADGAAGTVVNVVIDGVFAGRIIIADQVKADAGAAVAGLKRLGVRKVIMLTGDDRSVAERVAADLGIDEFHAQLLPEEKVAKLEEIETGLTNRRKQKLAFVGDGINDAPVISRADIGVAMGGLGSDAAIEAADVVLMEDAPSKLVVAVEVARRTRRIVRQNIYMALGIKGFFILLGGMGVATIWEAIFADVGVALLAVFNASRALRK